jgi:DNA (cytosine-5)-methyltransferase 1
MPKKFRTEFARLRVETGITPAELAVRVGVPEERLSEWEQDDSHAPANIISFLRERANAMNGVRYGERPRFRFIDLFAGIGGLRRGFESIGGHCVFTSEWDRYAQATYKANFECDHEVAGDITQVHVDQVPDHDVLLVGFPCQPFSIAGVSKKNALRRPHGFDCETQGTLFFDVERIIATRRPKAFLLENVKNLVNHDRGRTFDVIYRTLTQKLGYEVHYAL